MSKIGFLVIGLLIGFYAGLTFVGIKLNRIEENVSTIADQLQIDIIEVN